MTGASGGDRGTNFCTFTPWRSDGGEGGYLSGVVITLPIESLFAFLFSIDPNCPAVGHDSSREAG